MSESGYKSLCILGRQPKLGLAELESLYGAEAIKPLGGAAVLDIEAEVVDFRRLGGTIKVARVLDVLPAGGWPNAQKYLVDSIPAHLKNLPEGKFTLGISLYGFDVEPGKLNRDILQIKKAIKASGRPVRVVPNKATALNSAQVLHNKLTHRGGWELLLVRDGEQIILAQTLFVQDIDAYAGRDQARPKRDPRVGMLPPKLAQIIVNLAAGQIDEQAAGNKQKVRMLDPFCGTGVILQEALLMGYSVMGSDIDPRMVDYAKTNLQWLFQKYPALAGQVVLEAADATSTAWPPFSALASEVFLGRPLGSFPPEDKFKQIVSDTNTIIKKFLQNLAPQLKAGRRVCLAMPAWRRPGGQVVRLPLLDKLTEMGYNQLDFKHVGNEDLLYYREDQVVARQLLVIEKAQVNQ